MKPWFRFLGSWGVTSLASYFMATVRVTNGIGRFVLCRTIVSISQVVFFARRRVSIREIP